MTKQSKHIKRLAMPKTWPLERKGSKYVAKPYTGKSSNAIPLVLVLRDLLKLVKTKREARIILKEKNVLVDNKIATDISFPVDFYDIVSIPKISKNYRVEYSKNGKFMLAEISGKEAEKKICKIVGKKMLPKKRLQINLHDGKNFIYEQKTNVNDSAVVDLKQNKIAKILPLTQKSGVILIRGKHLGAKGTIEKIENKEVEIRTETGIVRTAIKNIFVIE